MQEKLNPRFLLALFLVTLVVAGSWSTLHAYQVRRNTGALLAYADRAEAEGLNDRAIRLLGLYLDREPDEVAVRARYALLLDRQAQLPLARRKVLALFEQVIERDPARHDIRRRLIEVALETRQFDVAAAHLNVLQQSFPDDPQVAVQLGVACDARNEPAIGARWYRKAIELAPANLDAYLQLARILRTKLNKDGEADACLDEMVSANKQSWQAYVARAGARMEVGRLTEAEADADAAVRLAPDEANGLLFAAEIAVKQGKDSKVVRPFLQRVIKQHPEDPRGYEALAAVDLRDDKPDDALQCLRQGLKHLPGHNNLQWNEANLLVGAGRVEEARAAVAKLSPGSLPPGRLEFLQAALQVRSGFWREGVAELDAVRPALAGEPNLAIQADLLLGQCFRMMGDYDRAVLAYRRVVSLEPAHPLARFGIVVSLLNQGRPDSALTECEELMRLDRQPVAGWSLLARLLIMQNLRLPASQRRWEKVDGALDLAEKVERDSALVKILRAEAFVGRGKPDEARTLLEAARDKAPNQPDYWIALAELADRMGAPDRAARLLEEGHQKLGDLVDLRLARARHLASVGGDASFQAIQRLADDADRFSLEERSRLLGGLANVLHLADRPKDALTLWQRVADLEPRSLGVRLAVFDLALRVGADDLMSTTLDAMRQIEGADGPLSRYNQARQLLAAAEKGERGSVAPARALLAQVANQRPGWSRVPLALAKASELESSPDRAIEHYLRTIELGDRQLDVVRRLVELLSERRRYAEADLVIRKLPEQTPVFANLQRLAAEVSLQTNDAGRALEYALKAVPSESKDPRDQRWLGQILWATGRLAEAERALRRAVELADRDPAGWVALVQFLARTQQPAKSAEAIAGAEKKLDKDSAPLALAQCYAAVGKPDQARELFQTALKAKPDDIVVLQSVADFALRTGRRDEAKAALRKIVSLQVKDPYAAEQAQKLLAVVLAAGGSYAESREALALIGVLKGNDARTPSPAHDATVDDQRARAVVLASQPRRSQQLDAIRILEELNQRRPLSAEDLFLLSQLYERVGDLPKSRDAMLKLLATEGENPRYLAHQVRALLRQGLLNDARLWHAKLEAVLPNAAPTMELKARLLHAQGNDAEAVNVLREKVKADDAATALFLATLLEELKQPAPAEEYYRRYVQLSGKPEASLELGKFLARHNRLEECLGLLETSWNAAPPESVGYACLAALRSAKFNEAACQRVGRWLDTALSKNLALTGLVVCQADLHDLQREYAQAETLYKRVLARDPRHLVALNNLAWQLALREGRGEDALYFANQALESYGPQPALLDTRALASLAVGKPAAAVTDLQDAYSPVLDRATLASVKFHLARAYQRQGQRTEAAKALQDAKDAGLTEETLHPLEVPAFRELAAAP